MNEQAMEAVRCRFAESVKDIPLGVLAPVMLKLRDLYFAAALVGATETSCELLADQHADLVEKAIVAAFDVMELGMEAIRPDSDRRIKASCRVVRSERDGHTFIRAEVELKEVA